MPRRRLHASNAERQKAYRQRIASTTTPAPTSAQPVKGRRSPSRPTRLAQLIDSLQTLTTEYEDWLNALPEALQNTNLGDRLAETISQLTEVVDLLSSVDPPKGFGRD